MTISDDLYRQILERGPSTGTLSIVLSKLKQEGQWERVIQECTKALNFHPHDISLRQLLAEAYFETGLVSQAELELEKVTAQINDLISAYKLQAHLYHKERRNEEASRALKVYLAHRPDDQEALDLLEAMEIPKEVPFGESPPAGEEGITETPFPAEETAEPVPEITEEEGLPEISTSTLAEIYFNQGQIREAIRTYENVLAQNPEDKSSSERLEELKAMLSSEPLAGDKEGDKERQKKEKTIAVLEAWLANIRAMSKDSVPA
ncbi:MAG: tetratricopeptide repeat protein [Desulfobacteraceae bacterium]|jgi:tetratricopeptide (TPR) repeat protein